MDNDESVDIMFLKQLHTAGEGISSLQGGHIFYRLGGFVLDFVQSENGQIPGGRGCNKGSIVKKPSTRTD